MLSDVAVVGGGPAGSATALLLARAGVAVTLVERAAFPRRKVCGEYQNCGAVAALERLGVLPAVVAAGQPLRGIRLIAAGAAPLELRFSRPALACDRLTLDAILLDAAIGAGVTVVRGSVDGLVFEGRRTAGLVYRDAAGGRRTLSARLIVGADGTGSVVARKLGLSRPLGRRRRFAVGGHYAGFGDLDGHVEMYVGNGAYFAINPLAATRANVMVVVPQTLLGGWSADIDEGVSGKAAELGGGRRSFAGVRRLGERVSVGPLAHRVRAPIAPGALLVGDAAGFLNPFTGQGVFLALTGAEAASAALLTALRAPAAEAAAFARYAAERRRDFRARSILCALVTLLVDSAPLARRAVRRLEVDAATRSTLLDALAGIGAPQRALAPLTLGRLLR